MLTLKEKLNQRLPAYMNPSNVGNINEVAWEFFYSVLFDFGLNPTWNNATRNVQNFQVSQEAAFLVMAIGRKCWDAGTAGEKAPLQIELRDRQSSRQFNATPIPLQNIGKKNRPTILPTPLLVYPNAFIDVTMTSWLSTTSQTTQGNGKFQIMFFGYRTRVQDAQKALSSVFAA